MYGRLSRNIHSVLCLTCLTGIPREIKHARNHRPHADDTKEEMLFSGRLFVSLHHYPNVVKRRAHADAVGLPHSFQAVLARR
jgi:hypothetical protein